MTSSTPDNVPAENLHAFCIEALCKADVNQQQARITADALVMTDTWGVFTHGTKLLAGYLNRLKNGGVRTDAEPRIDREGPGWAIVDGGSVLGQVIGHFAMQTAVKKAASTGIAYVGVHNSFHFGAAGYYTWMAAEANMIGLSMANDVPSVAGPGSRKAVTGTNPFSYAIPAGPDRDPVMLDIAMSTVAGGKVYAAVTRGEPVLENWIIGPDGKPTTDGSLYPHAAALAPLSGHKGYGLALMIEALAGTLTGAAQTHGIENWLFGDPTWQTRHGAAFLAVDVATIMEPDQFFERLGSLIDEIHEAPTADGVDRLMVPGEREWVNRRRALEHGIQLPTDVWEKIQEVADAYQVALPG